MDKMYRPDRDGPKRRLPRAPIPPKPVTPANKPINYNLIVKRMNDPKGFYNI